MRGIQRLLGEQDGFASGLEIDGINPSSGRLTRERLFHAVPGVAITVDTWTAYFARMSFDPTYHRVTATKTIGSDGSQHVGWVTDAGDFVDVSAAVHKSGGDFSGQIDDIHPTFGADGAFYFADLEAHTIVKVASTTPKSPSDATVVADNTGDVTNLYVYPSGTIVHQNGALVSIVENRDKGVGGQGKVEDWLSSTTMLSTNAESTQIVTSEATSLPINFVDCSASGSCDGVHALLPNRAGRLSWNPVASPDGRSVAFLSAPSSSTDVADLFTVSVQGGEPAKLQGVPIGFAGPKEDASGLNIAPAQLIGWF